jgi:hypothetical protein
MYSRKKLAVVVYTNYEDINAVNVSYEILDLFIDETSVENKKQTQYKHSVNQKKEIRRNLSRIK